MSQMSSFRPKDYQVNLPVDKMIVHDAPDTDDTVPMDVIFVGGGPAGLSGSIELARLIKKDTENGGNLGELEIGVLEKAESLGGHNLSGAVVNPIAFKELFPELKESDFPFRDKVNREDVYMLKQGSSIKIPTPPTMHNKDNYTASICEVVRWLGEKAEGAGVNLLISFPADSLLVEGRQVVGVRTTPAGLDRQGNQNEQSLPATDIKAKITVLSEGTRGTLSQAFMDWRKISSPSPQIFALGVKELWKSPKKLDRVIHTMGWPLTNSSFGGSFMYPMGEDLISFGLVVGLDYKESNLDVHKLLQHMKSHPLFKPYYTGADVVEWGAKTIPEGGYHSFPESFHGDGLLMLGDAVGFVNVPALKGIHYAMMSGILAARTIFNSLKQGDYTTKTLSQFDDSIRKSFIYKDLYEVRNMRQAFKSGFYVGGFKASLMTLTRGAFPGGQIKVEADNEDLKQNLPVDPANVGLTKVDAVYLAGNKTRDDIPQHLIVGKDISGDMADFYACMCPAGVYERNGDTLTVNAPNCIDCKATDILGPRWTPREGGSGPNYQNM